ncbi:MAG TPA: RNA polymerase sigma factor [Paracoccaceae bacterium]|nr:RNA polymerase sigma factor [Paracoccaceae bacterium]HMO71205.1 RNA polymerase sigma factor [Paracoccaceae bacterium]
METPDETLARAAARGDRAAFAALVGRHYDRIFGLAWRLTGRRDAAEDLAQDICAGLPAKLASFRAEARFTTWLYRVVVNAAEDARRRQATRSRAAEGWGDWEAGRQADIAEERAAQDWLAQAMRCLPPDVQATLALTLGEGLNQAEAAEVLGVAEGTVAWRMSEAKRRLRAQVAEEARE